MSDDPLHILIIEPDWSVLRLFRLEMTRSLKAAGFKVSICAAGDVEEARAVFAPMGVDCYAVEFRRNDMSIREGLSATLAVARLCRRLKIDVALGTTVKPATFGLLGARLGGVRSLVAMITGLGFAFTEGREPIRRLARAIAIPLFRLSLRKADRIIFLNPDDEATFDALKLMPRSLIRVQVGGSGVDLQRFSPLPVADGPFTFLMVGRLLRDKGVFEFVDAARMVKRDAPDTRFLLVGPLDSNPTAVQPSDVEAWKREGVVTCLGFQSDVKPFLAQAHVFVLPSYREGTPAVALEALASARPVLVTDVPGCREVVRDGVFGRLVQVRNAAALAEGMRWFMARRDRLSDMGTAGRAFCAERFDVHVVNRSIIGAIQATVHK